MEAQQDSPISSGLTTRKYYLRHRGLWWHRGWRNEQTNSERGQSEDGAKEIFSLRTTIITIFQTVHENAPLSPISNFLWLGRRVVNHRILSIMKLAANAHRNTTAAIILRTSWEKWEVRVNHIFTCHLQHIYARWIDKVGPATVLTKFSSMNNLEDWRHCSTLRFILDGT